MKHSNSFWEQTEWLKPADLFIVGGGITGASIAFFYKQRFPHHDVVIADRGITPEGASTRNAGFACIGSVSEHLADLEISDKHTVFGRIERRWNGLKLLREIIGDHDMDYQNTGGCEIFRESKLFETARRHIPLFNQNLEKRIGVSDVYSETQFEGYPSVRNRVEGAINSGKLMRSLHQRLSEMGVRTWWNCKAVSVKQGVVTFEDGFEAEAGRIVVAVNGFSSRLVDLPITPARGYIFVTKPIRNLKWRGTFHYDEGYVYFRNIGDRLLLGGGRNVAQKDETTDYFGINPEVKNHLTDFAGQVLKLPDDWQIETEWSGIMGMTENKEPVIQQTEPGVWVAAGLSGMGIAIGMQVAKDLVSNLEV
jgi:gamma-glutamylputrescine oxidase